MKSIHSAKSALKSEAPYKTYLKGLAISAVLYVTFWGAFHFIEKNDANSAPPGEERLQIGRISSEGYFRKADRSILIYTVKTPSRNPTARLAERTLYVRRDSCNKPHLEIGDTVFLKVFVTQKKTTITSAYTLDGCVLQDTAVLKQMSAATQGVERIAILTCGGGVLFFTVAAFTSWMRKRNINFNNN